MATDDNTIRLEALSLYICLSQLMSPGFHWALFVTDANGVATCYQWAEDTSRRDKSLPLEAYFVQHVDPVLRITKENTLNLTFQKVIGYTPAEPEVLHLLFSTIFEFSYADVQQNREAGISCRTWLMKALEALCVKGHINRSAIDVAGLEERMKEIGSQVENHLAEFGDTPKGVGSV